MSGAVRWGSYRERKNKRRLKVVEDFLFCSREVGLRKGGGTGRPASGAVW